MPRFSILFTLALGCGSAATSVESPTTVLVESAARCHFDGAWSSPLRAPQGAFVYARLWRLPGHATLVDMSGVLRFDVSAGTGGWSFTGIFDPRQEDPLSARELVWLTEGIAVLPGARVGIAGARPDEVLAGPPRTVFGESSWLHFTSPVSRWIPCAALGPGRSPDEHAIDALGFPTDLPVRYVPAARRAPIANAPGRAPFAEIGSDQSAETSNVPVRVVEVRGEQSRIVFEDWSGVALVGWTPTAALTDDGGDPMDAIGHIMGNDAIEICSSTEPLELRVRGREGAEEVVGSIAPGTELIAEQRLDGGEIPIRPAGTPLVSVAHESAAWIVRPTSELSCEQHRQVEPAVRPRPEATLTIRATVRSARGAVANGSTCDVRVEHFTSGPFPCRAVIHCGGHTLFGALATNGFLQQCTFSADPPSVLGEDTETSEASGDAAIRIDTGARRLTVDDDARGPAGALHVEARIDSVVPE